MAILEWQSSWFVDAYLALLDVNYAECQRKTPVALICADPWVIHL
jgi:hypothetical protein